MRLRIRLFFIIATLLLLNQCVHATHSLGGEMTYRALGNNRYLILVKAYHDCNAVSLSNLPLTVTPQNCSSAPVFRTMSQISITDITSVCGSVKTACSGGSYPYGIE